MCVRVLFAEMVKRHTGNHPGAGKVLAPVDDKRPILLGGEFTGQSNIDLTTQLCVLSFLHSLHRVPQSGRVMEMIRHVVRPDDLPAINPRLAGVVVPLAGALIIHHRAETIRRRSGGRTAITASDDLSGQVIDGHRRNAPLFLVVGCRGGALTAHVAQRCISAPLLCSLRSRARDGLRSRRSLRPWVSIYRHAHNRREEIRPRGVRWLMLPTLRECANLIGSK